MRKTLITGFLIFFILLVTVALMNEHFSVDFGRVNYFEKRGVFFLFFITLFPRLTLLFSSVLFGGFFWWLGFFFCPRILVAILATVTYFYTNPVLVVISWMIALSGEVFEKWGLRQNRVVVRWSGAGPGGRPSSAANHTRMSDGETFEAEYRKMDD
jgi:hypothetical protein